MPLGARAERGPKTHRVKDRTLCTARKHSPVPRCSFQKQDASLRVHVGAKCYGLADGFWSGCGILADRLTCGASKTAQGKSPLTCSGRIASGTSLHDALRFLGLWGSDRMNEPTFGAVQCLSPAGIHTMRYTQWGDPHNPRVLVCVHGLARVSRDFDRLARALCHQYRVICPDVVGRGQSDWLRDPAHYMIHQYVGDMVTLIARLDVEQVAWLGTSMGGLIGIGLAGLRQSPVSRLVINDVGPRIEFSAVERILGYVGQPVRFATVEQAIEYNRSVAAGFGMRDDTEWREMTLSVLKADGDGFVFHYDPAIRLPWQAVTPQIMAAAESATWRLYDAIGCPTLLLRGENSDLLSPATAAEMSERGPRARVVSIPGVGHAPMFFDPAQIEVVRSFLSEN